MKRIIVLLVCLVFIFAGCKQLNTPPNTTQSSNVLNDPENNTTSSSQDQTDDRITIVDNKKVFDNGAFTLSVPSDWKYMEFNEEDGRCYSFQHPTLGEKCQILLYRTALGVSRPYTEDQCLTYLSQSGYENAKISYYERGDINGYGCRKLVFSYSIDNTQFIGIHYIDIIWSDFSIYDFRITYPASEQETFEPVFNSILNSIKLKTPIEDETDTPYALHEITDERITIVENKKVFYNTAITLSVPSDWKCMEVNGEDGGSYFFQHPTLGEKCQISLRITGSVYLYERTEAEYLAYLSYCGYKDVKITTFEKDKIDGYTCTKVVFSYSLDNAEFVGIHYENLVEDARLYDFSITYPASEQKTFEPVFNSILDSIKFTTESP